MILLHARRLLRAVLSAGSQHFSSFSPTQITYAEREVKAVLMLPPGQRGPWLVHVSTVLSGHFSFFKKLQWVTVYTVMDHMITLH